MKLLRLLAIFILTTAFCLSAEEPVLPLHPDKTPVIKVTPEQQSKLIKFPKETLQDLQIFVIDSMANNYAYFGSNNPIAYDPVTNTLALIRRGYVDIDVDKSYSGIDEKNNLFIKYSTDWGNSWTSENVYNEKVDNFDGARYPSVAVFQYQGTRAIGFTSETVKLASGAWTGFITGYYNQTDGAYAMKNDSLFTQSGTKYKWDIYTKFLGHTYGASEDLSVLAAGGVSPLVADLNEASNLAIRKSDLVNMNSTIPSAWASSKFVAVTQTGYRANEITGFRFGPDGIYMAAHGNFTANDMTGKPTVGFSKSTDNGNTWSEFDVFPFSVCKAYANSQGANGDSVIVPYTSKDFQVLPSGDVSFVALMEEYNATKTESQLVYQIIEIYKESGAWGVRKVADIYPSWMVYRDYLANGNASNPLDIELQLARTPDGKYLFAKWVELIGVKDTVDQYGNPIRTYKTTDVFASSRLVGNGKWMNKANATNSALKDRTTIIPDYVPNGLQGIPIFSTVTKINPNYTQQQQAMMVDSAGVAQYIVMQIYNHTTDVNDGSDETSVKLLQVHPNPAVDQVNVDFTLPVDGNADIVLTNMVGQKVMQVYSGLQTAGFHSVNFNVNSLPVGTYNCTVTSNGYRKSVLINIVR